jgi:hypothetical protein
MENHLSDLELLAAYHEQASQDYLIDPDGKVITKIFNADNVETELAKAFVERR